MLTKSGAISFNAINIELGNGGTDELELGAALTEMGEGGNPDSINECYGYDDDWKTIGCGWLEVTSATIQGSPPTSWLTLYFTNHSQANTQSETIYWRVRYMGTDVETGSTATGTVAVDVDDSVNTATFTGGWPHDDFWVSYDNTNWITGISIS